MNMDLNQATEMIGRDILIYCAEEEIEEYAEMLQSIVLEHIREVE